MNRYNLFYQIHKGLRAMLYETSLYLQQTDFNNADETETALAQLETVINLFNKHAHTEDTVVFAAIQKNEPALINAFEQEHEEDHALGQRLSGIITAFNYAATFDDKMAIGAALNQAFLDFMIFNLKHMAREEDIINQALWKYYTDAELQGITQQIVGGIPPQIIAQYNKWMIRGLSNNEIVGWLKEVKNVAPDFVFQSLMQTAEHELNIHRLQLVQEAITEGAMVA
jgi:Hemerythrin HHE cation binding domain